MITCFYYVSPYRVKKTGVAVFCTHTVYFRILTTETQVCSQDIFCGICGKVAIKQGFLSARPCFPANYNSTSIVYLSAYYTIVDNDAIRGHISSRDHDRKSSYKIFTLKLGKFLIIVLDLQTRHNKTAACRKILIWNGAFKSLTATTNYYG